MGIDVAGFTGTVNQQQWSDIASMSALRYAVDQFGSSSDPFAVKPVTGVRSVTVETGKALGCGVLVRSDAVATLAIPTPAAGRWYKIAIHRDWAAAPGSASIIALPWTTTTDVRPTAANPATTPATGELHNPGSTQDDQIIAQAWVSASSALISVFDKRPPLMNPNVFIDSGWVPIDLEPGFASYVGTPAARRIGGVIIIRAMVKPTSGLWVTGSAKVGTVPAGMLIGQTTNYPIASNGAIGGFAQLSPNGGIYVVPDDAGAVYYSVPVVYAAE